MHVSKIITKKIDENVLGVDVPSETHPKFLNTTNSTF